MKFIHFILWCFVKIGERIDDMWDEYGVMMRREPFLATILGVLFTILSSIGAGGLVAAVTRSALCASIALIVTMAFCIGTVVYRLVNIAYNAFKQERRDLFETIKRG